MTNDIDTKTWIGEFFIPGRYEERFTGKIVYSLETGLTLEYFSNKILTKDETLHLFGTLEDGNKCSLIGLSSPEIEYSTKGHYAGTIEFMYLLLGDHLTEDFKYTTLDFSLVNIQDFFFSTGFKNSQKYSEEPIIKVQTAYGEVTVFHKASFIYLKNDISAIIYNKNKDALNELQKAYAEINDNDSESYFLLKTDFSYAFGIEFNAALTVEDAFKNIMDVADLFAILIYRPVYPESIKFYIEQNNSYQTIEVYSRHVKEKRTINIANNKNTFNHLPINFSDVNLAELVQNWINAKDDYNVIVSSIQSQTKFHSEHSMYGDLLIYSSQLESISYKHRINNKEKYLFPIEKYGLLIKDKIEKVFKDANMVDIGKAIADLRDEIAHVGKPKKILKKLDSRDLLIISLNLELVIIGYILSTLGLEDEKIQDYQLRLSVS